MSSERDKHERKSSPNKRNGNSPSSVVRLLELLLQGYGLVLGLLCVVAAAALHSSGTALIWVFVLAEIGGVLISLSLLHVGNERILRDHLLQVVLDAVRVVTAEMWEGHTSLRSVGVLRGDSCLPAERLSGLFANAKRIRILKTWHLEDMALESGLRAALTRPDPAEVKYFLCHPDSRVLRERAVGAGEESNLGIQRNRRLVEQMAKWIHNQQTCTACVTFYDAWPGTPVIECDELLFVGFFPRGLPSPSAPWLEVSRDSEFGKNLLAQFDFGPSEKKAVLETKEDFVRWCRTEAMVLEYKRKPSTGTNSKTPSVTEVAEVNVK